MKKYICLFISGFIACLVAFVSGYCLITVKAVETFADNTAFSITASGKIDENGCVIAYYKNQGVVSVSFDVLKAINKGCFGIVFAESADDFESYGSLTNYVAFTSDGSVLKSNGAAITNNIVIERGNNYRFDIEGKNLSVKCKGFYEKDYTELSNVSFPNEKRGFIGLCAFSEGINSSNCIIDNLLCLNANGEIVFYNGFNYSSIGDRGTLRIYSTLGSYAEKYDQQTYNVAFVDEQGNLISTQRVCEYNYVSVPDAPDKKGCRFNGWSGDYSCITEDVTFYPVYVEARGGCGSNIYDSSILLCISFAVLIFIVFLKRRRYEKN